MDKKSRIYVAGHRGLAGSAIMRKLQAEGYTEIITRSQAELDLTRQKEVEDFFSREQPDYVFLAAAKVGGILANSTYPADFISINLSIQTNVLQAAYKTNVRRLIFLGSSCIYPKASPQPIKEEYLLTGLLEPTNEAYAIAKIAGIKMCQAFNRQYGTQYVSVMPTNLYGPNDNFDLENSHVLPALIRKFHMAANTIHHDKSYVEIWGTGKPLREFLYADDLADACCYLIGLDDATYKKLLNTFEAPLVNVGWGKDITIYNLAMMIKDVVGFNGNISFDKSKPDGMPQKRLDISRIQSLGWTPGISLKDGITRTYEWCLSNSVFEDASK